MESNLSKFVKRNKLGKKFERYLLKLVIFTIPVCFTLNLIYPSPKIINSIPILLSLAGLIQLEIAGLFECIENGIEKSCNESGRIPSYMTRALYEFYNPEPTLTACINNNLYLNKRVGYYLMFIGGIFQLYCIWSG